MYTPGVDLERTGGGAGRAGLGDPGPQALAQASIVFIPALALSRDGSGSDAAPAITTAASAHRVPYGIGIVYDDEVLDELPVEATDVPMDWALTPEAGFRQFRP